VIPIDSQGWGTKEGACGCACETHGQRSGRAVANPSPASHARGALNIGGARALGRRNQIPYMRRRTDATGRMQKA
jgi:hypothetical protein